MRAVCARWPGEIAKYYWSPARAKQKLREIAHNCFALAELKFNSAFRPQASLAKNARSTWAGERLSASRH